MFYKVNFLTHMHMLSKCVADFDVQADFDFQTFEVGLRARGARCKLFPRFLYAKDGTVAYTSRVTDGVAEFIGWLPYASKRWDLSTDKLVFKDYCVTNNLNTPKRFDRWSDVTVDVVLKRNRSSFGQGVSGPFRQIDARNKPDSLGDGEYLEQFIRGTIAKAWYWDGKLIGLELFPFATIVGDGRQTIKALIEDRISRFSWKVDLEATAMAVAYFGRSMTEVPALNDRVVVDFRYNSLFRIARPYENPNSLSTYRGDQVLAQLSKAGPILWQGIPPQTRHDTLFTLDAMIDDEQRVWFLEMNSNPLVNPDMYKVMFEALFGSPVKQAGTPELLRQHS